MKKRNFYVKKKELYKRIHGDPREIEMYRTFNYELNKKFVDHMVINKQITIKLQ